VLGTKSQFKGSVNEMKQMFSKLTICLVLTAMDTSARTKLSFDVATTKPAQPIDQAKLNCHIASGGKIA
jgi:hypothetical protein